MDYWARDCQELAQGQVLEHISTQGQRFQKPPALGKWDNATTTSKARTTGGAHKNRAAQAAIVSSLKADLPLASWDITLLFHTLYFYHSLSPYNT